jgi:hypothetical protein
VSLLEELKETNHITNSQLRVCNRLIDKIQRDVEINYQDVEDLQTDE